MEEPPPPVRDKLLFTPGPLTTSAAVKQAMLRDLGSRDTEFVARVQAVREKLLEVAGVSKEAGYEAILMPGSGTLGVEAVLGSTVPPEGRLLVLANGAYGERMLQIAEQGGIPVRVLRFPESSPLDPTLALAQAEQATHVAVVHCETSSGMLNPVAELGRGLKRAGKTLIVDGMSSFGALPLDLPATGVHFLVSSSNKCLEGVPGLSVIIAERKALLASEGRARSLSLDLVAQWRGFESRGQFRFTPPTQVLLGLEQALRELEGEGGPPRRLARYTRNHAVLLTGMRALGFREYLPPGLQAPIITSFHYPKDPRFHFEEFYARLGEEGMVIYPGKVSVAACFRIANIGRLFEADLSALLSAVGRVLTAMGFGGGRVPP